jgi:hypothetical protein
MENEYAYRLTDVEGTSLTIDQFERPVGSDIAPKHVDTFGWDMFFVIEPRKSLEMIKEELTKKFPPNHAEVIVVGGLHAERLCVI